jgi:hypothetical protein
MIWRACEFLLESLGQFLALVFCPLGGRGLAAVILWGRTPRRQLLLDVEDKKRVPARIRTRVCQGACC